MLRASVATSVAAMAVAVAVGCASAATRAGVVQCKGSQLAGRFAVVPGSAGAGNIVYRLTLRNRSQSACALTGLPVVRLLAASGSSLPTHVISARRGDGTLVLVHLAPRQSAQATARFSPDVPGVGEGGRRQCERTAARLRVTPRGGGSVTVPISPPTPVCEHGQLQFSGYTRA